MLPLICCHCSIGDVVFELSQGTELVTEVKYIPSAAEVGNHETWRTGRRKKKREAEAQARKYARVWRQRSVAPLVLAACYNNEDGMQLLAAFPTEASEDGFSAEP